MNESEKVTKITETGTIGWDSEISKAVSQSDQGSVWYMCLKTKNCCLKIFVEIRVGEKVYGNT